jgi:hypothetical protein
MPWQLPQFRENTWKPMFLFMAIIKKIPLLNEENKSNLTSSDTARIKGSKESKLWPVKDSMMRSNFGDLFFVTLDTPKGTNIISINEAISIVLLAVSGVSVKE